jgi:hypothetical protein
MPGRDKVVMELLMLLLAFMAFYVFSPDIVSLMKSAECAIDIKPVKALFMFLAHVFGLFSDIRLDAVMYLIGGGIIILNGRRR